MTFYSVRGGGEVHSFVVLVGQSDEWFRTIKRQGLAKARRYRRGLEQRKSRDSSRSCGEGGGGLT